MRATDTSLGRFFSRRIETLASGGGRETARRPMTRALSTLIAAGIVGFAAFGAAPAEAAPGSATMMAAARAHGMETQRDHINEMMMRATLDAAAKSPASLALASRDLGGGFVRIGEHGAANLKALDYVIAEGDTLRLQIGDEVRILNIAAPGHAEIMDHLARQPGLQRLSDGVIVNADNIVSAKFEGGKLEIGMIGDLSVHGTRPGISNGNIYLDGETISLPATPELADSILRAVKKRPDGLRIGDTAIRLSAVDSVELTDDNTITIKRTGSIKETMTVWSGLTQALPQHLDVPVMIQVDRNLWRSIASVGAVNLADDGIHVDGIGGDTVYPYDAARADAIEKKLSKNPGFVKVGSAFVNAAAVDAIEISGYSAIATMGRHEMTLPLKQGGAFPVVGDERFTRVDATWINIQNTAALHMNGDTMTFVFAAGEKTIKMWTQNAGAMAIADTVLKTDFQLFNASGNNFALVNLKSATSAAFQPAGIVFGKDELVMNGAHGALIAAEMTAKKAALALQEMADAKDAPLAKAADGTVNLAAIRWVEYGKGTLSIDFGASSIKLPASKGDFASLAKSLGVQEPGDSPAQRPARQK